ncbi:MAG: hypothetical protein CL908_26110 [Deltaproteobacteria bacterium]|nr:hypothetical protein [Deltaproteobacteria bacterium]
MRRGFLVLVDRAKALAVNGYRLILIVSAGALLHCDSSIDKREIDESTRWPVGTPADIERLRERGDVNVLFVLVDTLRADRLGAYGYERDTSPNLDRLAQTGFRFSRHLAQSSWTKASMASLWTGYYPTRTGVRQHDDIIPEAAVTAAEVFQAAGDRTIGLYRNGWVAPTFGFQQGFDTYTRPPGRPVKASVRRENPTMSHVGSDEDVILAAREFLRVDGDEPWFLYLHLMDLHEYTYDSASALFGGSYSDIYDNSIRSTDTTIGILLDYLYEWEMLDDTIVIVGSDHGEAFRERGHEGHARFLYKETTEVPLLMTLPFRMEPGIVVRSRSRNIDIFPTVIDLLGLDWPEGTDGVSLRQEMADAARFRPTSITARTGFAQLNQNWARRGETPLSTESLVQGSYRYVRHVVHGRIKESLFDATEDVAELRDVSDRFPETLEAMRAEVDAELDRSPVWGAPEVRELDELELNQLRALGYQIP